MNKAPSLQIATPEPSHVKARKLALRRALALEWISIAWMVVEAAATVVAGVAANSLSLLAFGLDS